METSIKRSFLSEKILDSSSRWEHSVPGSRRLLSQDSGELPLKYISLERTKFMSLLSLPTPYPVTCVLKLYPTLSSPILPPSSV
jgi:hypothetical protein